MRMPDLPPLSPVGTAPAAADHPPVRLRLSPKTRSICKRIGIRFNGEVRTDVFAYDVEAGWIETRDGDRFEGTVDPYWRGFAVARPVQSLEARDAAIAAAEAKRARKAARRAELAARQ